MWGKKKGLLFGIFLFLLGGLAFRLTQGIFHKTNSTEFCVSCHSMSIPQEEWEGSVHFANSKGIRAECADCHLPPDSWHYVKAKVMAVKDVWGEITGKIPDQEAYEAHRLEMAQAVWKSMKEQDSATCRTCHKTEAWILGDQSEQAQTMHKLAAETNQTCIDCHKGLVHFIPDIPTDSSAATGELSRHAGDFSAENAELYAFNISAAKTGTGEIRLMPFAKLSDWRQEDDTLHAVVNGWQQSGAENLLYQQMGKRILVGVLDDNAKTDVSVISSIHDTVTNSDWQQVKLTVSLPKTALTANLDALNAYGKSLDQTHCSTCHATIPADHYTANQWVGVINSMKDRTSMSDEEVRAVTIYLQHFAKDMPAAATSGVH
ncbi:trimethylamine-N-oxide reductase (cytochrome c), cytochrome c-type subunit TorY [Pasteurella testudinis DSM 23072]|uniref:Cytochrome c-type protein n=1 Tax=Pasteurella testudinis DSM 23072 TaxID=1122938 RepID=A0A1W1USJ5_9PAST|nr:NapC/NirT family cytochrome c [Pasteurella testudinis]SMB84118.1 trimethylamine-N-oxide reductase (cytochrome c), cytochrome c-type subunit TorY [Pasteurella testudinis DSM 23072]SUB50903.1 cytochrome c-type protein TorY [Pasteurella testudinis]